MKPSSAAILRMLREHPERFWAKVAKGDGCWEWTAHRDRKGYGVFRVGAKVRHVNRVSWELTNGPIPDGLWVLHHCDNPPCVRPDHLWLGTAADNARDMIAKHRADRRGIRNNAARMTPESVIALRRRHAAGEPRSRLALDYRVAKSTVARIIRGETWAEYRLQETEQLALRLA